MKNRFTLSEWSGAIGDLGTSLPLAFALVVFNGYSPERIFFLWGLAYIATGWFYRVPVAIQPLKAMAVIAIDTGFTVPQLATSAVFYGILLLILSLSGAIRWLERWFSQALVRGIQLGIGLILMFKAFDLMTQNGFFLGWQVHSLWLNALVLLVFGAILFIFQFQRKKPISPLIIFFSVILAYLFGISPANNLANSSVAELALPQLDFFKNALILLIIPQLPLTIGNAVFAASDACHNFWRDRAKRVNPTKLGLSIGLSNIFIGFLGGFPICHGAGGIAAHAKFGGKTGGTTIIIGSIFIGIALVKPLSHFLFLIPIPILGVLLLFTSWSMISLVKRLQSKIEWVVAGVVGIVSLITRNLSIALITGFVLERTLNYVHKKYVVTREERA